MTDEQLRWLYEASRPSDVRTARACIAALSTSEIVASEWTKELARAHCQAVLTGLVLGAQLCREMMAGFVAGQGQPMIAASVRANWDPAWGKDPGGPVPALEPHRCAGYTDR